ncbi:glycosyltransferase family 2 protein [Bacillus cereus]|uniref:glycosyltransferase family 2 protein n=1 Tax=Bacillus cereus TaxID=1396 RepID=UPI00123BBAC6|nr:glycosyltransferase family 2 protein [Bacillus cereus]KAA6470290.1 glycosyltransferase [Bacillus cereus]
MTKSLVREKIALVLISNTQFGKINIWILSKIMIWSGFMSKILSSIIIPVHNQALRLDITLMSLVPQVNSSTEIIVVDDGSTDNIKEIIEKYKDILPLKYKHQSNRGRAAARNIGIMMSTGDIVLFLDADRPVANSWLGNHIQVHEMGKNIIGIGDIREFYFSNLENKKDLIYKDIADDFKNLFKFSRVYPYWNFVLKGFNQNGICELNNPWIATLVGNMSLRRELLEETGLFDENFTGWGFEHFELGYRLFRIAGAKYMTVKNATNFHLSHPRTTNFYQESIIKSHSYFYEKYNDDTIFILKDLLNGKLSLGNYDLVAGNGKSKIFYDTQNVFYKSLSL